MALIAHLLVERLARRTCDVMAALVAAIHEYTVIGE